MDGSAGTHVIIVGAGLSGALMACFLGRAGYRVDVYERRGDPRGAGFTGGRSINLALSARGIHALSEVGLAEEVLADAVPMRGRMMHGEGGELTFQPYSKNPEDFINSVSRGGLNVTLLDAADNHDNVTLHFNRQCVDVDLDRPAVRLVDDAAGVESEATADFIIGADGAFSVVRGAMQRTDRFDYRQDYLAHGYKELTIPPDADGGFAMEPNALHIWPRGGSMMIALPNRDCSFTCTLFWPFTGPNSFAAVDGGGSVEAHFKAHFGDAVPLMPKLVEEYDRNPTSSLATIRCGPWHDGGKVVLIGDAAHAVVPFYGQGINAGFEDCVELDACLQAHPQSRGKAFAAYHRARKENADAIADLALENFIEMRDKVGSRAFLLKKRLEKTLHRLFPSAFLPQYNMVSFSLIPYAETRRRARRQARAIAVAGVAGAALLLLLMVLAAVWIF